MSAGFIEELKRRNVIRTAIAYLVGAWVVIQAADILLPIFNAPDWVLRVIVMLLGLGLVITVIVSWAYEATDEGLRRDGEAVVSPERKRRMNVVIALLAMIGIGLSYWIYEGEVTTATDELRAAASDEPSIAVLPFVNMSGVQENEYFSDGLTETLLHMLAQVDGLKVAARTSAFAFKGRNEDVREIGRQLAVNHVLEGSVQRAGNRVRVTAQLIDASDGSHVWSENFDRDLDDIFAIQDEIATSVASRLRSELLASNAIASMSTSNTKAYDMYLRALEQQAIGSYESLPKAETLFKAALLSDPEFYDAQRELARNYIMQTDTGLVPLGEKLDEVVDLLQSVTRNNPDDHVAAGMLVSLKTQNTSGRLERITPEEAVAQMSVLVEAAPNETQLRLRHFDVLGRAGDVDGAIKTLEQGLKVDPLSSGLHYRLGSLYGQLGQLDKAETHINRARELNPANPNIVSAVGRLAAARGDIAGLVDNWLDAMEIDPRDPELPGQIAIVMYTIDFNAAGDYFTGVAEAINPENPLVRAMMIRRVEESGNIEQAYTMARDYVADPPPDRQGAWEMVFEMFVRNAVALGREAEAISTLQARYPDSMDYSKPMSRNIDGLIRLLALFLYQDEPEVLASKRSLLIEALDSAAPHWRKDQVNFLALAGVERDADRIAELLDRVGTDISKQERPRWVRLRDWPYFEDIRSHPRIAAWFDAMESREQREQAAIRSILEKRSITLD